MSADDESNASQIAPEEINRPDTGGPRSAANAGKPMAKPDQELMTINARKIGNHIGIGSNPGTLMYTTVDDVEIVSKHAYGDKVGKAGAKKRIVGKKPDKSKSDAPGEADEDWRTAGNFEIKAGEGELSGLEVENGLAQQMNLNYTEESVLLTEKDVESRFKRVSVVDTDCDKAFKVCRKKSGATKNGIKLLLQGKKEIVSIPVVGMKGAPMGDADKVLAGDGMVSLVEAEDKKLWLLFFMDADTKTLDASETWSENVIEGIYKEPALSAETSYEAQRTNDQHYGFSNIAGNLFHVHFEIHDRSVVREIFGGKKIPPEPKGCCNKIAWCKCDCCACCGCGVTCCGKCGISCCAMSCCGIPKSYRTLGNWNLKTASGGTPQDIEYAMEIAFDAENKTVTRQFPGVQAMTFPQEHAKLTEFQRIIHLQYRSTATNKIQECKLLVQKDVSIPKVAKFCDALSYQVSANPELKKHGFGEWSLGGLWGDKSSVGVMGALGDMLDLGGTLGALTGQKKGCMAKCCAKLPCASCCAKMKGSCLNCCAKLPCAKCCGCCGTKAVAMPMSEAPGMQQMKA